MIRVLADAEAVAAAAAALVAEAARAAVAARGRFAVALSGGSSPRRAYELLAAASPRGAVPWPAVEVFWGDERCVPPDDERSNARMARRALLDHVPVAAERVHPIECAGDPAAAAGAYEGELRRVLGDEPVLDLVLLGLGREGHTASLFPGGAAVDEEERWAVAVPAPVPGPDRVTLTLPVLRAARRRVFLVLGEGKAEILRTVLEGAPGRLPAQRAAVDDTVWLVDEAAASRLGAATRG